MPANPRAALYLRSSKDRNDVSIEAQRRELQRLAADRGLLIVQEYADVVESGKDELRPGFQKMLADLKRPERAWSVLLLLDTSRLARRRLTSIMFEELEAKRHGITIVYKNLPELEAAESMLLRNQLQGLDEYHSLVSKRKGLTGMATNIERGFRAGGRAPRGYRLKPVPTGTYREGAEVMKSVLEPSSDAPLVARYLKARAGGQSRRALVAALGITWPATSLVGMEWNALTYAGHTVWNAHNEYARGQGYKGGQKRRPRGEWIVKRDTHAALITDAEAEAILASLDASPHKRQYRTSAAYLLTGLLKTPEGGTWHGNGAGRYRMKENRRNVDQDELERAVVERVRDDLGSDLFARQLLGEARRYVARHHRDPAAELRPRMNEIATRIARTMDLAARLADPDPALRQIDDLERQRKSIAAEIGRLDREHRAAGELNDLTADTLRRRLDRAVAKMQTMDRESLKDLLGAMVDRIVLDPATLECQIHYQISVREMGASPRACAEIPILRVVSYLKVA